MAQPYELLAHIHPYMSKFVYCFVYWIIDDTQKFAYTAYAVTRNGNVWQISSKKVQRVRG